MQESQLFNELAFLYQGLSKLIKNKLMILPSGDKSVRFRPHLNVIKEDLNLALEIIHTSLRSVLN